MEFKENNKPIYLQLVDKICDDVLCGIYGDDCRIPSVREFAAQVEVNANTVMRTYDYLQQNGIIYNKRGIGYFVMSGASDSIKKERMERFMNDELREIFGQLKLLGVTPEQLLKMYTEYCK